MKTILNVILNWRYYVLFVLFAIGIIGLLAPTGEVPEDISAGVWIVCALSSLAIGFGALYAYDRCVKHWERENKIPELTNLTKLCDG